MRLPYCDAHATHPSSSALCTSTALSSPRHSYRSSVTDSNRVPLAHAAWLPVLASLPSVWHRDHRWSRCKFPASTEKRYTRSRRLDQPSGQRPTASFGRTHPRFHYRMKPSQVCRVHTVCAVASGPAPPLCRSYPSRSGRRRRCRGHSHRLVTSSGSSPNTSLCPWCGWNTLSNSKLWRRPSEEFSSILRHRRTGLVHRKANPHRWARCCCEATGTYRPSGHLLLLLKLSILVESSAPRRIPGCL